MSEDNTLCGAGPDARYCPRFLDLNAEVNRLRELIGELLDCTGLDDDEKREYLERAGLGDEEDSERPATGDCREPHGPDSRCFDCATDEEMLAAIPPYPAPGAATAREAGS